MSADRATSRGGAYPVRRGAPPPLEFFAAPRPAAGTRSMGLRLDRIRIELAGLDDRRTEELLARYAPYSTAAAGETPSRSCSPWPTRSTRSSQTSGARCVRVATLPGLPAALSRPWAPGPTPT